MRRPAVLLVTRTLQAARGRGALRMGFIGHPPAGDLNVNWALPAATAAAAGRLIGGVLSLNTDRRRPK